ncbi:MAG TPA: PAS domain S-box protein, partial [Methanocella sp.]
MSIVKKPSRGKDKSGAKTDGHAIEALQQSEERYRLLVEKAPLGILTCDAAGNIITANRKILELVGSSSMDFTLSVNLLSFQPLIDSGIAGDFAACLSTGRPVVNEHDYVSYWNKKTYIRYNLAPIWNSDGTVTGLQGIFEDITEIKQAEAAFRNSEACYRTLFENAGAAILIVDTLTGMILDCNTIAEKLVGRTRDEITRMIVTQLHPPDDPDGYGN